MNTKHLVDKDLLPALENMPPFSLSATTLAPGRAMLLKMLSAATVPVEISVTEHYAPGPDGAPDVRLLVFSPRKTGARRAAFLHLHGGGYVMGAPQMFARQCGAIIGEVGCVVVSVDYRLAPETVYPGPLEDCYAALRWLYKNSASFDVDPARIVIGGESAGGGLAAALGLLARDRGDVPVAFQLLSYPMLDDRTGTVSKTHSFTGEFVWNAESNQYGWQSMLGHPTGGPAVSGYAAAARADDLAGLPPTWIGVGSIDLFVEENIDYARRLLQAGVPTELHVYPGAYHGFDLSVESAAISKQFRRDMVQALRRAVQG